MDKLRLKSKQRDRKRSSISSIATIATLLIVLTFVLLDGRVELISSPEAPTGAADNTQGTAGARGPDSPKAPTGAADNSPKTQNEHLSAEQVAALRQNYINRMGLYERETKPEIEKLNLRAWSPESITELREREEGAMQAFAQNQFGEALANLDSLLSKVTELQSAQNKNFSAALQNARQAFASGHFKRALAAANEALRYRPANKDALFLKSRIDVMEAVAELIEAANTARAENKIDEEISLLERAIQRDPHRAELVERHRRLLEKRRQRALDALLQQAAQALDNNNIKEAQTKLSQVRQIDAQHPSLKLLESKMKRAQTELSYRSLIAKAKAAEQNDDWQATERHYRQAQRIASDSHYAEEGLQRATQIIRYTQIIQQALARPERLADEQISTAMRKLAKESDEYARHSAQLQELTDQLNYEIVRMSRPVEVTVYSDGKTHVSVLSVGVIGKVSEYRLQKGLKPGRYLFKGERRGFKDKLVEVHIKPDQAAVVSVVCDETI